MEQLLIMMKKEAESVDSKLIVFDYLFPPTIELKEQLAKCTRKKNLDYNADIYAVKMREITSKLNIKLIQTGYSENTIFSYKHKCDLIFLNKKRLIVDSHLTKCGHEFVASKILETLNRN